MAALAIADHQRAVSSAPPTSAGDQPDDSLKSTQEFSFSPFLRKEYRFGISPSRPYCKAFREGHCPLGPNCPDKHPVTHSTNNLVCKHWLKGLCKKGDSCDFLHEYNIRARPECTHFARGYCTSGDDCNYLHVDPNSPYRRPLCPHYERGFCPLGPKCAKRHVGKKLCRFYLAGFCPYGKACKEGEHPRFPTDLPKPSAHVERAVEEAELERQRYREEAERREEMEWERNTAASTSNPGGMPERGGRGRGRGRFGPRRRGAY